MLLVVKASEIRRIGLVNCDHDLSEKKENCIFKENFQKRRDTRSAKVLRGADGRLMNSSIIASL